ncbi:MAG: YheT family hydrolase [Desulfomonilia bacterium]
MSDERTATNREFIPPAWLRGTYVQTILASSRVRLLGANPMEDVSQEMILEVGENIRLQGFFSPQLNRAPKGLAILLHGWEGSAHSTYTLHSGRHFYSQGYAVFRLNFRDHGGTHHLNEGIFYATLLDEVFEAVKCVSQLPGGFRSFLVGFSLGGNFSLRIARKCSHDPIENLKHIFAISPVINPSRSTDAIDRVWLLREYFLIKWRRSLRRNQELYPHLYDFTEILSKRTIRSMTDALIHHFGVFQETEDYFRIYTITDDALKDLNIPTTIITSQDDPAIPVEDFHTLRTNRITNLCIHDYGGHNGFLNGMAAPTWYEEWISRSMDNAG